MQSARTTAEALAVLKNRLQQGIGIESFMYVEVLKRCKDLMATKQVHDCIMKSKMDQNLHVANNLLIAYIRCRRLSDARRLFDKLVNKDLISWNVMIGGYAQHNHKRDAMELFNQMRLEGVQPDAVSYVNILKACASPSPLKWGKEVHGHIRRAGLESNVRVGTALVQMYAKCGSVMEARETFEKLTNRNIVTWSVMMKAYVDSGSNEDALRLLLQMKQEGIKPDAGTFSIILNASTSLRPLQWVKEIHSHVLEAGVESDLRVSSALIRMYAKSGSIDDAREVFDRMKERDLITWTVMIGAYAGCDCGEEAYRLLLQMKQEGFKPDAITFLSILNAGTLKLVKEVHSHVLEAGLESDMRVSSALVHMYAKSGSLDDAKQVFDRMKERDVTAWLVMIRAYAESGRVDDARRVFDMMKERDLTTWNTMIDAYAESGRGEEAYRLLLQMKKEGLKPNVGTIQDS